MTSQERKQYLDQATALLRRSKAAHERAHVQPTPQAANERLECALRDSMQANLLLVKIVLALQDEVLSGDKT